jgi:tetratricopeptide (TPR) repeat protein
VGIVNAGQKRWLELRAVASRHKLCGELRKAITCLEEALSIPDAINPLDRSIAFNSLANLYLKIGDFQSAERAANEAIVLETRWGDCGRETNHLADDYLILARVLEKQGRYAEAAELVGRSLVLAEGLGGNSPDYIGAIANHHRYLIENKWRG